MPRVACIGECMLELSGADKSAMTLSYGGDTLNTAVYLARLDVEVDYVTALGDDPYSDWMIEQWRNEGVGTDLVVRAKGRVPGFYAIQTDDSGERQFFYWREQAPARDLLDFEEFNGLADGLLSFDWIYLSGITLSIYSVDQRERLLGLLDTVRSRGGKVMFDTNYRPRGWPSAAGARETMTKFLTRTDLALPTLDDDRQIFGDRDAEGCAARLHAAGVSEVVVKMDAEGCLVSEAGAATWVAAIERPNPRDTTGAGDSFNAGYLAARLEGLDGATAAGRAHSLAGNVIMHPGAIMPREAMPGGNQ